jgi:hypothetical protein
MPDEQQKVPQSKVKRDRTYVELQPGIHNQLTREAKLLKLTNSEYASAAVGYFTERGLNPASDRQREGMVIQAKIDKRAEALEQQVTGLGNRLFGFLQTHEKNLYSYLQSQQRALFSFLQKQEGNLFQYLTEQEKELYTPLLEEVLRGAADAFIARRLGEQIVLRQQGSQAFDNNYTKVHAQETAERDAITLQRLVEVTNRNSVPDKSGTELPALTTVPSKPTYTSPAAAQAPSTSPVPPRPDTY